MRKMDTQQFIQDYREAFGQKAALPLLFGYSDQPEAATEKIGGCFFKGLLAARDGVPVSLSAEVIGCGGGFEIKDYDEFAQLMERFASDEAFLKESGSKAGHFVKDQAGATDKVLASVKL